ncbi:LDL receptor repeat-containing protein egg-1-like [Physella acuta]|uniref:LDL receptor repeat-containing protein egg-1-like n=1 Tax=Physella acuta TaxID=109671 RepID=UPI0027DC0EBF|nr:LDL receptor repeat-containing protein egg-1-like [Physella acuta]
MIKMTSFCLRLGFFLLIITGAFCQTSTMRQLVTTERICRPNDFPCDGGIVCLPMKTLCDTVENCEDGSDERLNCPTNCSHANQFKCTSGNECKPIDYVCDGINDCTDGSDEQNCEKFVCPDGEIKCDNHRCIAATWICDRYNDCGNNWDETGCRG